MKERSNSTLSISRVEATAVRVRIHASQSRRDPILYPGIQAVNVLFNAVKLGALTWKTAMDSCTDNTDSTLLPDGVEFKLSIVFLLSVPFGVIAFIVEVQYHLCSDCHLDSY